MREAARRRAGARIVFPLFFLAQREKDSRASSARLQASCGPADHRAASYVNSRDRATAQQSLQLQSTDCCSQQSAEDCSLNPQSAGHCSEDSAADESLGQPSCPPAGAFGAPGAIGCAAQLLPFSNLPTSMRRTARRRTDALVVFPLFFLANSKKDSRASSAPLVDSRLARQTAHTQATTAIPRSPERRERDSTVRMVYCTKKKSWTSVDDKTLRKHTHKRQTFAKTKAKNRKQPTSCTKCRHLAH